MGFSLADFAPLGAGFTKQTMVNRRAAEQKKAAARQSLQRFLQMAAAQKDREDAAGQIQSYREAMERQRAGEFQQREEDFNRRQGDVEDLRKGQTEEKARVDALTRQNGGLRAYLTALPHLGDMAHDQQRATVQEINQSGTDFAVPGEVSGTRLKNYGQADPLAATAARLTDARMRGVDPSTLTAPTYVPDYQPTPDQTARRGQEAASTQYTTDRDKQVAPNAAESVRHHRAAEALGIKGLESRKATLEESRRMHDWEMQHGDASLDNTIRHEGVTEGQGGRRLTLSEARGGGRTGSASDPLAKVNTRLTALSKPGKYNILTNSNGPALKDTPEGKQEYDHLINQRRRLLSQPVNPMQTPGYAVVPGVGAVHVPPAGLGPLPPPEHHSATQPRHPKTQRFLPGNLRQQKTKALKAMLGL